MSCLDPATTSTALDRLERRGVAVEDGEDIALDRLQVEHDLVDSQALETLEAPAQGVVVDDAEHRPDEGAGLRPPGLGPPRAERRDLRGEQVKIAAVADPAVRPADDLAAAARRQPAAEQHRDRRVAGRPRPRPARG